MAYSVRMAIWQRICWTRVVRPRRCRLFLPGRMSQVFSKNPPLHRLIRLIVCQLFSFLTRTTCRRVSLALDGMSKAPCFAILGPSPGSKAKPITGCGTFRPTEQKVWYTGGWWGYVECGTCRAVKMEVSHPALASGHFGSRHWWVHFPPMFRPTQGTTFCNPGSG